ncbi:putative Amidohydrolase 2 [Nitrospira sp. KM1]|uniref:amidohydrolase family protein n=1 Tax=Nitrospira sp. KM1 TaxID=1936990 RepID=UPI0013A75722|nr:amidohydrolase family protein [Nitrospira sp. KM1]BCA55077.1 putative Amidohydrolase 2 [Nitrospira sp. KM1]
MQHDDFKGRSPRFRRGHVSVGPIPTRHVSNEEFVPLPQTKEQETVEHLIEAMSLRASTRAGMTRRSFLKTSGGMAAALIAMNTVFGRFFNVLNEELYESDAFAAQQGSSRFIFDVQTHYVSSRFGQTDPDKGRKGAVTREALIGLRRRARETGLNPLLRNDRDTIDDLSWQNFVKEIFLDSETSIGLISTPPGPYPQEAVVPPKEMAHIRDEINRLAGSQRMLAHGLVTPQLGKADLEFMAMQAETLKVDAWKGYTGSCPKGFDRGWWMDDEKLAYPMLEQAKKLNVTKVCIHKGLPLGPVEDYNHPKDLIKAAKDFPDIDFLVYHSGFKGAGSIEQVWTTTGEIPWTTEFCKMKRAHPEIRNIYMELGSTFAQLVTVHPLVCAHLLGQIIDSFGTDHVLWGTDSIWSGTPQWQIEAFRRFTMPDHVIEKHGYQPLTDEVKAKVFGLNAARVFGIDVSAVRQAVPQDYVGRMRMSYLQEGPEPSHRLYGWVSP